MRWCVYSCTADTVCISLPLSLYVCLVWPWYSYVWTNAMSLENWRKVNLFAANSVFMGAKGYTVHYLIYTYLFVSHYLLFSVHFLFVTFFIFFFPLFHAESKFCMFACLYVSMVVWLSVNIFYLAHFFYYIAFLYGSHELERERVIEVKKNDGERFKVHFPHRFLSLTLYCEIS